MKKVLLLLVALPFLSFGQNAFDLRSPKNPNAKAPTVEADVIDGRNSNQTSFRSPIPFQLDAGANVPSAVKYEVKYEPDNGLPIYVEVLSPVEQGGLGVAEVPEEYTLSSVLSDLPGLFQWDEHTKLVKHSQSRDKFGYTHIKYQQYTRGLKVNGGEWILHLQGDKVLRGNGRIYPSVAHLAEVSVSEAEAITLAEGFIYANHKAYRAPSEFGVAFNRSSHTHFLLDYAVSVGIIAQQIYTVEVRPTDMNVYEVYIDAQSGTVLKVVDVLCEIDGPKTATATDLNSQNRTVKSYQLGSTYYMIDATKSMWTNSQPSGFPNNPVGAIWTIDAGNTAAQSFNQVSSSNNTWSERSSVSAHANAGLAFDYFKNTHARNSLNGSGGTIISVVNVSDDDGSSLANAYWNGQAMFYSNGGNTFTPLSGALDVAGHELTHGVISNTANLEYEGQSGAINESMADVFVAMIDRDDWKMGEDIVRPGILPGGALRDLKNPHNGTTSNGRGYQPENMGEYFTGSADNYGVHINSGIVNRAFYLTATGTGMSKDKAEDIWYKALTDYLTKRSKFLDLRYACADAAKDIFTGADETAALAAINNAFDIVQIYDSNGGSTGGGGTGGGSDIPVNPGSENIISFNISTSPANTFERRYTDGDMPLALSTTLPSKKASVTDDGAVMFYISSTDELRRIFLSSPYTEATVSNDDFSSVAVSKDGKRVATVSAVQDGKISVYDFATEVWTDFTLYNPTYTEGVDAGNVNYADAIEFDNTGQFILYDAQNELTNASGNNISWWDVGVLRVWDNGANSWGDGKVEKVFSSLPDGVSIGNATYAKNSPFIIAYDYISATENKVVGTNLLTGKTADIFNNSKLGYPNFSNKDDKIIFDAETTDGGDVIAILDLADTKIEPKTSAVATVLIQNSKWGVWYANGQRSLLSDKKELLSFSLPAVEGAPQGVFSGTNITVNVPLGTDLSSLTPTFTYSEDAVVVVGNTEQVSGVSGNNFGSSVLYKVTAQDGSFTNYAVRVNIVITGVDKLQNSVSVYPNPVTDKLMINTTLNVLKVVLTDISGGEVDADITSGMIDMKAISAGMYLVHIQTRKGVITKRVMRL
jgi:Zn-dependent metalloprotease